MVHRPAGSGAMGVKDVAARAGVSVGTVSNVLNRPALVAEGTRGRVRAAMDELGFLRNESARQLRAGESRTVAVVVLDVANPFFTDVISGVEEVADEHGVLVMVCNSGGDPERERRLLERLAEMRVMGVLITPVDDANLSLVRGHGIPVVLVDHAFEGAPDADGAVLRSVAVDDVLGGRLAGAHLASRGHRRCAFVGGPRDLPQVRDRLAGFREGLAGSGVSAEPVHLSTTELSAPAGARAAAHLLAMAPAERPSAVFCANDLLALGFLSECTRAGVVVPDDLAIVGYDDIPYAEFASVPLTSVRQPRARLGRAAAEVLVQVAAQGAVAGHADGGSTAGPTGTIVFRPELVIRASSAGALGA